MGKLYDDCTKIQSYIESQGLDVFKTRGELAIQCGFLISLVHPDDADDPQKLKALHVAAREVLGLNLD